jgi:septum formation protein
MFSTTAQLILASRSPRRRDLLEQAGLTFSVIPGDFDEEGVQISTPADFVTILAEAKANEVADRYPQSCVIGADTIVTIDEAILGKPADDKAARAMLDRLSGRSHQVFTGFAVICKQKQICIRQAIKTDVAFRNLSEDEIDGYINTGEPFDKAGAYAIQGLGSSLVRRINGSYTNVVGLPVCEVIETLLQIGIVKMNGKHAKGQAV